jgi:hypothetical protein
MKSTHAMVEHKDFGLRNFQNMRWSVMMRAQDSKRGNLVSQFQAAAKEVLH